MGVSSFKKVSAVFYDKVLPLLATSGAIKPATDDPTDTGVPGGVAFITAGSAAALTLGTPVAGDPAVPSGSAASLGATGQNGDDGKVLTIVSKTAYAHTITTAANKINSNKQTITFTAAIGNYVVLEAHGGVWWMVGGLGATLS